MPLHVPTMLGSFNVSGSAVGGALPKTMFVLTSLLAFGISAAKLEKASGKPRLRQRILSAVMVSFGASNGAVACAVVWGVCLQKIHLSGVLFPQKATHFFQSGRFDLANALGRNAVGAGQVMQCLTLAFIIGQPA